MALNRLSAENVDVSLHNLFRLDALDMFRHIIGKTQLNVVTVSPCLDGLDVYRVM